MLDDYHDRLNLAQQILQASNFEKMELSAPDRPNFKAYKLVVDGLVLGEVKQCLESVHRKSGRIITSTRRVPRWSFWAKVPAERNFIFYYDSRQSASEALIERMIAAGWTYKSGKLGAPKEKR